MMIAFVASLLLIAPVDDGKAKPSAGDLRPSELPSVGEVRAGKEPEKAASDAAAAADVSPLVHEAVINAPVSEVWKVFSTAEGFKLLGVAQCEVDFRVGGFIKSHYTPAPKATLGDEGTIVNQIIAYDPERMMAFRLHTPPQGFPFMNAWKNVWSVATFSDAGQGRTHLRLAGIGYSADEESQKMREFFKNGNAWTLKKLQTHFDSTVKLGGSGDVHASDPLAAIEVDEIVNGPREEVYRTYTTSAGWKEAFGVETKIEMAVGGAWEIYFSMEPAAGQRGSEGCTVLSFVPGEMVSHSWNAPPKFVHARAERTWVVVRFEDAGAGRTRVRLTHLGFAEQAAKHAEQVEEWKEVRGYFAGAWPKVLGAMKGKFAAGSSGGGARAD